MADELFLWLSCGKNFQLKSPPSWGWKPQKRFCASFRDTCTHFGRLGLHASWIKRWHDLNDSWLGVDVSFHLIRWLPKFGTLPRKGENLVVQNRGALRMMVMQGQTLDCSEQAASTQIYTATKLKDGDTNPCCIFVSRDFSTKFPATSTVAVSLTSGEGDSWVQSVSDRQGVRS